MRVVGKGGMGSLSHQANCTNSFSILGNSQAAYEIF